MSRQQTRHIAKHRERGMSMVVAIFLVVVIASLAAFAVSVGAAARTSTNLQLVADRALAAANAGAEWGAYRALRQGTCSRGDSLPMNFCAIRGFRVTVDCLALTVHPGGFRVADIRATAQWGNYGSPEYAYRQVVRRYDQ